MLIVLYRLTEVHYIIEFLGFMGYDNQIETIKKEKKKAIKIAKIECYI